MVVVEGTIDFVVYEVVDEVIDGDLVFSVDFSYSVLVVLEVVAGVVVEELVFSVYFSVVLEVVAELVFSVL